MPEIQNARPARLYVAELEYDEEENPVEVAAEDMIEVTALQEITPNDEAATAEVKARDLSHVLYVFGEKTFSLEFAKLLAKDESADDITFLRDRYDDGAPFWALLTTAAIDEEGSGVILIGSLVGGGKTSPDVGPVPERHRIVPAEAS